MQMSEHPAAHNQPHYCNQQRGKCETRHVLGEFHFEWNRTEMQDRRLVLGMFARHDDLASHRIQSKNGRIFDMLHRVVRTVPMLFMFGEFEMMIFCFLRHDLFRIHCIKAPGDPGQFCKQSHEVHHHRHERYDSLVTRKTARQRVHQSNQSRQPRQHAVQKPIPLRARTHFIRPQHRQFQNERIAQQI